jgi:hypothetical protein
MIVSFLVFQYNYSDVLFIYIAYQVTFVFGNYLMRMETLALKRTLLLSFADVIKQKGYLAGMVISYFFYKVVEFFGIVNKETQVYYLHALLLVVQIVILWYVFRSFRTR